MSAFKNFFRPDGTDEEEDVVDVDEGEELHYTQSEAKTSSYEPTGKKVNVDKNTAMVLFEPRAFEECELIGSYLKNDKAVVVNLHRLQRDSAQRTIDFLNGVVFAVEGSIQKIGHNVILCSPKNLGVSGQISLGSDDN